MKRLAPATLLNLLELYDRAIAGLEQLRDPGVAGLIERLEHRRREVAAALAAQAA
jgi:hypothetical protein